MFAPVHIHLLLNHVPIILTFLGLLFILIGVVRRRNDSTQLALWFFVGAALFAVPTYLTGEPSEDAVEHLPGVTKAYIHQHETVAFNALVIVGILGVFALWALWKYRRSTNTPRWIQYVALVVSLFGSGAMAVTGLMGGEIRHTEIRAEAPVN